MDQSPPSEATAEVPAHLILRPRMRTLRVQLFVGLGLLCCLAAIGLPTPLAILFLIGILAHEIWFRASAPVAFVATPQFLGIAHPGGRQRRVPWSSIRAAAHSTGLLGMQWKLDLLPAETTVLRDLGIHPDRWGLLRAAVIESAARHGAKILVDPLSEATYGSDD